MGGGGAMRAAAKVAGMGVMTSGIRGGAGSGENSATLAAIKAVRPVSSGLVSAGGLIVEQGAVQRPAWELDDWEFAGSEDEFVVDRNNNLSKPRVVFGPVPTIEETKEATSELKDALDKVYLTSPKSTGSVDSFSLHETKACITHESSVPKSAMQAFRLLKESPAAQTVVASIACDPNVWNAVMQNPSLLEYLETEKNSAVFEGPNFESQESPKSSVDSTSSNDQEKPDGLMALLENVRLSVVDMVQNLTDLVQSWFVVPEADKKPENIDNSFRSIFASGSFMALAMMVIMVVVMKRA